MPGPDKRLFRVPPNSRCFCLGYAELTPDGRRFNTQILVEPDGSMSARTTRSTCPVIVNMSRGRSSGTERRYFEPGDAFDTWSAFGGVVEMATCNDRRRPETYRVLALNGAELILIGYNTPKHYA